MKAAPILFLLVIATLLGSGCASTESAAGTSDDVAIGAAGVKSEPSVAESPILLDPPWEDGELCSWFDSAALLSAVGGDRLSSSPGEGDAYVGSCSAVDEQNSSLVTVMLYRFPTADGAAVEAQNYQSLNDITTTMTLGGAEFIDTGLALIGSAGTFLISCQHYAPIEERYLAQWAPGEQAACTQVATEIASLVGTAPAVQTGPDDSTATGADPLNSDIAEEASTNLQALADQFSVPNSPEAVRIEPCPLGDIQTVISSLDQYNAYDWRGREGTDVPLAEINDDGNIAASCWLASKNSSGEWQGRFPQTVFAELGAVPNEMTHIQANSTEADVVISDPEPFSTGMITTFCWNSETSCISFWKWDQGDLVVGVDTSFGNEEPGPPNTASTLKDLLPAILTNLAAANATAAP